jgi:hypothetical protein
MYSKSLHTVPKMLERREMAHRETGSVHRLIMGITGWGGGGVVFPLNVVCSLNTLFLLALTERLSAQMHPFIYNTYPNVTGHEFAK